MWIIVLVLLSIVGYQLKYAGKEMYGYLDYQTTVSLRGICAIEIMIGHIGKFTGALVLRPFQEAGLLIVGIFFFLSGYGIMYGVIHKENYMRHFILKKYIVILLPAYIVYLLRIAEIASLNQYELKEIIGFLFGGQFFNLTNWFVWEILFIYLLFFLNYYVCKLICGKTKLLQKVQMNTMLNIILFGTLLLFTVVVFILGGKSVWYSSALNFSLGVGLAQYEEKIRAWIIDKYRIIMPVVWIVISIVMAGYLYLAGIGMDNSALSALCRILAAILFSILIYLLYYKFRLLNKILIFFGEISFEIYLIHFVWLNLFKNAFPIKDDLIYAFLVIVLSICSAIVLNKVDKRLKLLLRRK